MNPWLRILKPVARVRARIVCLPCTAGAAAVYRSWAPALPRGVELSAVELPGHGTRAGSEPEENPERIADRITRELAPLAAAAPLVLFGHGTGALLAYETARRLCAWGAPPSVLVPAGLCPADRLDRKAYGVLAERPDQLRAHLGQLGHAPPQVLASPDLRAAELHVARADLRILAAAPAPAAPLDVPLLALAGRYDPLHPGPSMAQWQRLTRQWLGLRVLPGDHFFPWQSNEVPRLLADITLLTSGSSTTAGNGLLVAH
ncbi:thioesterase II family protein [Streptomyces sp. NPDC007971]|uniref:thioesterase II family protein n=1 Tax=unclassified Streptomyces TaxID=2593676 RepID=UPI003414105E